MVEANTTEDFDPEWKLFQNHYAEKIQVGRFDDETELTGRSKLDDLLEVINVEFPAIKYEDFCLYCTAVKVSACTHYKPKDVIHEADCERSVLNSLQRGHLHAWHRQ
jgi:hypothetical protein